MILSGTLISCRLDTTYSYKKDERILNRRTRQLFRRFITLWRLPTHENTHRAVNPYGYINGEYCRLFSNRTLLRFQLRREVADSIHASHSHHGILWRLHHFFHIHERECHHAAGTQLWSGSSLFLRQHLPRIHRPCDRPLPGKSSSIDSPGHYFCKIHLCEVTL